MTVDDKKQLLEQVRLKMDYSEEYQEEDVKFLIAEQIQSYSATHFISMVEKEQVAKYIFDALRKLDILQELLDDTSVTEIMVNSYDRIFYEKNGELKLWDKAFESEEKLLEVIQHMAAGCDRTISENEPILDGYIKSKNGSSRYNITLSPPSLWGNTITIRKFPDENITMAQMVEWGTITQEAADFLETMVKSGYNLLVGGGTSSGKTTFLNALSEFIPSNARVITIEDSAELRVRTVPNLVGLETKNATASGGNEINMRDLIRSSLRMRPDLLMVGEVRGPECFDMLQALNSGHDGSMCTAHANGCSDMISRLEAMVLMAADLPIESVRMQILSGIDLIIHLERGAEGKRRVVEIAELSELRNGAIALNTIFMLQKNHNGKGEKLMKVGNLKNTYKWTRYQESVKNETI